jgi:ABC-type glycerol-3-phosphate transport system substrate-binding protein
MRLMILNFNRTSAGYRVKATDYSKYDTGGNPGAGMARLNAEITGGNIPDILILDNMPYGVYASKGVLEDLYPYIDADAELGGRDGIVPAILKAAESENGALHRIASSFAINTAIASADYAGPGNGWSMDDVKELLERHPGMSAFGEGLTRGDMLGQVLQNNLAEYVDWQTGAVSFDSPEFAGLMEFIKQFPAEIDQESYDYNRSRRETQQIARGGQLAGAATLFGIGALMENATLFENAEVYKGFPCESERGSSFTLYDTMGISSKCENKDGAWEFVRTVLGADFQRQYGKAFPTSKRLLDAQFDENMTPVFLEPIYDENGRLATELMSGEFEYCRVNDDGTIEGPKGFASVVGLDDQSSYLPYYAMTREQRDRFTAFIGGIDRVWNEDQTLLNIVSEELAPFFAGQKDAASAAKIIQSRAEIYVNEQR